MDQSALVIVGRWEQVMGAEIVFDHAGVGAEAAGAGAAGRGEAAGVGVAGGRPPGRPGMVVGHGHAGFPGGHCLSAAHSVTGDVNCQEERGVLAPTRA